MNGIANALINAETESQLSDLFNKILNEPWTKDINQEQLKLLATSADKLSLNMNALLFVFLEGNDAVRFLEESALNREIILDARIDNTFSAEVCEARQQLIVTAKHLCRIFSPSRRQLVSRLALSLSR